jgi:hypothetical protein
MIVAKEDLHGRKRRKALIQKSFPKQGKYYEDRLM